MKLLKKIQNFGKYLEGLLDETSTSPESESLYALIRNAKNYNHWFTEPNIKLRLQRITNHLLSKNYMDDYAGWLACSCINKKTIGVISEEKIPLEELPVLLAIIFSQHNFLYKTNEKSDKLLPYIFQLLVKQYPEFYNVVNFTEGQIKNVDSAIVTKRQESNSTAKKYFSKKPSLFETRHQSIAVISGDESHETLSWLGNDIFTYFGLGSGNVRKIYLPEGFDIHRFYSAIEPWQTLLEHSAYTNNYQYYQSVYLLNRVQHLDNGFLILKEDASMQAPLGVLYYQYYKDKKVLFDNLINSGNINFIYTSNPENERQRAFGESVNQLLLPSKNLKEFLV